jgi:positive regulator of sigma E activity
LSKIILKTGVVRKQHPGYVVVSPLTKINSEIEVVSKWDLNKGDIVKYAYFLPRLYFYKFVVNVVPVIDFVFFYLLSFYIVKFHLIEYLDKIQVITLVTSITAFLVSKFLAIYFDRKTTLFNEYKPVVLAVMKKNSPGETGEKRG